MAQHPTGPALPFSAAPPAAQRLGRMIDDAQNGELRESVAKRVSGATHIRGVGLFPDFMLRPSPVVNPGVMPFGRQAAGPATLPLPGMVDPAGAKPGDGAAQALDPTQAQAMQSHMHQMRLQHMARELLQRLEMRQSYSTPGPSRLRRGPST